jgi:hypothetical protein
LPSRSAARRRWIPLAAEAALLPREVVLAPMLCRDEDPFTALYTKTILGAYSENSATSIL